MENDDLEDKGKEMTKYRFPILVPFCVGLWDLGKFGKAGGIF
jgi:hypothetical protein